MHILRVSKENVLFSLSFNILPLCGRTDCMIRRISSLVCEFCRHTIASTCPYKKQSRGVWSGDLAIHACGPQWPIQQLELLRLMYSVNYRPTCGSVPSCWNHTTNTFRRRTSYAKNDSELRKKFRKKPHHTTLNDKWSSQVAPSDTN
jgi:hypothetical protein